MAASSKSPALSGNFRPERVYVLGYCYPFFFAFIRALRVCPPRLPISA